MVRTKKEQRRSDGRYIRFDTNAAVLLNSKKEPLGTRINGVVSAELRNVGNLMLLTHGRADMHILKTQRGWSRIAALSSRGKSVC